MFFIFPVQKKENKINIMPVPYLCVELHPLEWVGQVYIVERTGLQDRKQCGQAWNLSLLMAKPALKLRYDKLNGRSKHFLYRNRFVGGFVNVTVFSCPSKLCTLDPVEESQSTSGFFLCQISK